MDIPLHYLPNSSPIPLHFFPNPIDWANKGGNTSGKRENVGNKLSFRNAHYLKKAKNQRVSVFCVLDTGNQRIFAPNFNQIAYRMNETERLIQQITEGIQDKKGKNIVIADLTKIEDTICKYFVICQGNSPSQVTAIVESVKDFARKENNAKPLAIDGLRNAEWVAMDYADILVHVFLPEARNFYNLETLWADAKLTQVPDLD